MTTAGEGQGLSEGDESRNNITKSVDGGCGLGHGTPTSQDEGHKTQSEPEKQPQHQHKQQQQQVLLLQPPQPPPPSPVIRWERFLSVRSLKVLLVENDGSTRQVVSALLRNCSYEVTAVSNGLEAWKVLEDPTNHIDIVLTEVVMPGFSGIALLSKIMNHRARKSIPVIMMSSHDSMGVVFKCLSKGAVDFLVKPIRKNELKNLWQHVWRRCHSSSGSGSESGIQTQKSVKPKDVDDSDNNTGSNSEDDTASIHLNMGDGSDNGSGTQSSWTKHVAEPEGQQPASPWNQLTETPDSTCAQVIHPKPEIFSNDWVPRSCPEHKEKSKQLAIDAEDNCLEKDLDRSNQRDLEVQLESYPSELVSTKQLSSKFEITKKNSHQADVTSGELGDNNATCRLAPQAVDLIGTVVKDSIIIASAQASNSVNKIIEDKAIDDVKEPPSFDLSLKRLRSVGSGGIASNDDRYVLRRSDHSAFSRYGTSALSCQKPLHGGSSVLFDSTSDVVKTDSINNMQSKQNINQIPDGSFNINDMGSTTNNNLNKPTAANENFSSSSTIKASSAFHPLKQQGTESQPVIPENIDDMTATKAMKEPRLGHQVQVQHHHHHYHHHHHHVHVGQQQVQLPADHGESNLKNMAAAAPPCGSSNIFSGHIEAAVGAYSINGSASGSNHGSNGQNGSSIMKSGGTNMDAENGLCEKNEAGGCNGSGSGSGSGTDHNRSALRVAALTKFRQKRKQRCFQKRVRYHSRKKLAEQRPRVRGQFVRQIIHERTSHEADC